MSTSYIALLSHWDDSGVIQAFGPYPSETLAHEAVDTLKAWPALNSTGRWDVLPCTSISSGPRLCPETSGHVGPWEIGCSQPIGHAEPHDDERLTDTRGE